MRIEQQIEFEARDDADAIRIARERLGREAVILSSRFVSTGGILGFFQRKVFMVKAGILGDDPEVTTREKRDRMNAFQQMLEVKRAVTGSQEPPQATSPVFMNNKQKEGYYGIPTPLDQAKASAAYGVNPPPQNTTTMMQQQVDELRSTLARVLDRLDGRPVEEQATPLPPSDSGNVRERLIRQEMDTQVVSKLIEEHTSSGQDFKKWLGAWIPTVGSDPWSALGGNRVMFVGPTGVGKTTSIAKIAAVHSLWEGRKVVMVTSDTYRIAAVEQLRTYAKILGVPLEVAFEPSEIKGIIKKHSDADLILLDTAGRSHKDAKRIDELNALRENFEPSAIQLVLASNLKYRDMLDVIDRMGVVPIDSVVFTKMDETSTFGPLVNVVADFSIPISFFTVGQNVPNDIEVATGDRLAGLLLGGEDLGK